MTDRDKQRLRANQVDSHAGYAQAIVIVVIVAIALIAQFFGNFVL